jgi:virulence factor Mce-like protein
VKRRRPVNALVANPVLIGAVTTLVVVVAVFLAYNANAGLPFVPTYTVQVETPDAARLVVGNEVREGGQRIGLVSDIEPLRDAGGTAALLTLELDAAVGPVPADTTVLIRPRSVLGLKYVDLVRGRSAEALPEGATIAIGDGAIPPEFDDLFDMFDQPTRAAVRENLVTGAGALAGRGAALNRALAALPELLADLPRPMRTLAAPETRLRAFVDGLADTMRTLAPVAGDLARGFAAGADTFAALSRDPAALEATIAESPATLAVGIRSLRRQRPFLGALADVSDEVRGSAAAVRAGAPAIGRALLAGTAVLPRTPPLNEALERSLEGLRDLAAAPTTDPALEGLAATMRTLDPTLRFVGPQITVCNYWNSWWTSFSDHLSERDDTGTLERVQARVAPDQEDDLKLYGAAQPADGEDVDEATSALLGEPVELHAQPFARAVDEDGEADCESGQRGYPRRLAEGAPPRFDIAVDPRTPGRQGPTATGRPRVPRGQTSSAEPAGLAAGVLEP